MSPDLGRSDEKRRVAYVKFVTRKYFEHLASEDPIENYFRTATGRAISIVQRLSYKVGTAFFCIGLNMIYGTLPEVFFDEAPKSMN